MKNSGEIFLGMFKAIESPEDCPVGVELLIWDGCNYHLDYVEHDPELGLNILPMEPRELPT